MKNFILFLSASRVLLGPIIFIVSVFLNLYGFALILILLASLTDYLDGLLARSYALTSQAGAILDQIADKVLVLFIFFAISFISKNPFIIFCLAIILARELLVSGIRQYNNETKSKQLGVTFIAKLKTTSQFFFIATFFIGLLYDLAMVTFISYFLLFTAMLLSLQSGLDYGIKSLKHIERDSNL